MRDSSPAEPVTIAGRGGVLLAADLWRAPAGAPGVVVVHGYGSSRTSHADFAQIVQASGISALTLDLRGHGASGGTLDVRAIDDVLAALDTLAATGAQRLGIRGSSLGGFLALHAAARDSRVKAVVAICPAHHQSLADRRGLTWARELPLSDAVGSPGVARGYWHATGDELVPWSLSWDLAQRSPHPRHLRIVLRGHHRSLQHDPTVQADTLAFLHLHLRPQRPSAPATSN